MVKRRTRTGSNTYKVTKVGVRSYMLKDRSSGIGTGKMFRTKRSAKKNAR